MNQDKIIESYIKETSERLKTKQRTLLIDDTPTEGSVNPVTSDGIKKYMDAKPSGGTEIEINTGQATDVLTGLQIDGDKYQVEETTAVEANGDVGDNYNYIASLTVNSNSYSFQEAPSDMDTSCDSVDVQVNQYGSAWSQKTWTGLTNFHGSCVWTDGENIYYSYGSSQYVLDKATLTWSQKTWNGFTDLRGDCIWTDGDNIYYSDNSDQYVLDKATSTWTRKVWDGLTSFLGPCVWTDGENVYYSNSTIQYVLNKATSTWSQKTWSSLTEFAGNSIWTDGENIYYSANSDQYVLDKSTSTWTSKIWSGFTSFLTGSYIWTDGENFYCSLDSVQYVLDKSTSTWHQKTWNGLTSFRGQLIWTDGENIYYSSSTTQYVLSKNNLHSVKTHLHESNDIKINTASSSTKTLQNFVYKNVRYEIKQLQIPSNTPINNTKTENKTFQSTWEEISDSFSIQGNGKDVWTDGDNIYYSNTYYSSQYVLDKNTSTWSPKTWSGLTSFDGRFIWTDGENIYYSSGSDQYVLDKETSTWSPKTWSGIIVMIFNGNRVWTDGENIYYSANSDQYVLDKSTSTWTRKTWSGLTKFFGNYVWTDGENIYYSDISTQYVLDKATSTWVPKTWSGFTSIDGRYIWTDGENIYYSGNSYQYQYVLDKTTSTWSRKTWSGLTSVNGNDIWTDGENIYLLWNYKLKKNVLSGVDTLSREIIPNNDNAVVSSTPLTSVTIDGVSYRIGFNGYILYLNSITEQDGVVSWTAPSLDSLEYFSGHTPVLTYSISVNGTYITQVQGTSFDVSSYLVSGSNTVSVVANVSIEANNGASIVVEK